MKWLKYLKSGMQLLGPVKELVEQFEIEGNGEEKKKAVLDVIRELYDQGKDFGFEIPMQKEFVLKIADKLIDIVVNFYNVVGFFTHKDEK